MTICRVCGQALKQKMDQFRGAHLGCQPKPRDRRGIEYDPCDPPEEEVTPRAEAVEAGGER